MMCIYLVQIKFAFWKKNNIQDLTISFLRTKNFLAFLCDFSPSCFQKEFNLFLFKNERPPYQTLKPLGINVIYTNKFLNTTCIRLGGQCCTTNLKNYCLFYTYEKNQDIGKNQWQMHDRKIALDRINILKKIVTTKKSNNDTRHIAGRKQI